jgi:hypothetical protein
MAKKGPGKGGEERWVPEPEDGWRRAVGPIIKHVVVERSNKWQGSKLQNKEEEDCLRGEVF